MNDLIDYENWYEFNTTMNNLQIDRILHRILSENIYQDLEDIHTTTDVNYTKYREHFAKFTTITNQDLNAFLKQIEYVSDKLYETNLTNILNKIYMKLRNILNNEYQLSMKIKEKIFYELIDLEISYGKFINRMDSIYNDLKTIRDNLFREETLILQEVCIRFMLFI